MSYLVSWKGSTEPADLSGRATFAVEGDRWDMPLPSFAQAREIELMLLRAFCAGKVFAARNLRAHVVAGMDLAVREHGLG